jgi:hypothetical protein
MPLIDIYKLLVHSIYLFLTIYYSLFTYWEKSFINLLQDLLFYKSYRFELFIILIKYTFVLLYLPNLTVQWVYNSRKFYDFQILK